MRIVHIDTGRELRGGQRQVMLLLGELRESGCQSILLARADGALYQAASLAGFPVHPATATEIWKRSKSASLVHAHDARGHTLAAIASRVRFVVSRRVAFPVKRSVVSRWKYAQACRYLAVSRFVAGELVAAGVDASCVDVIYDAVQEVAIRDAWRADGPIVAISSTDAQKGRDLVEQAAARLGRQVVFSSDLEKDLREASLFLYLTRSEGLGSAVLLAMTMGVPVIATRTGGIPEIIQNDGSGLLVNNDVAEVAAAVDRLQTDRELAAKLICGGADRVRACFTVKHLLEGTLASYGRALSD